MADVRSVNVRSRLADGCLALFRDVDGAELVVKIPEDQYRKRRDKPILCEKRVPTTEGKSFVVEVYQEWYDYVRPDAAKLDLPPGEWQWVSSRYGAIFDTADGLLGASDFYPGDAELGAILITEDKRGLLLKSDEYLLTDKALTLLPAAVQALTDFSVKVR